MTVCAACGKEGGDTLKACTACKLVKYCNRSKRAGDKKSLDATKRGFRKGYVTKDEYANALRAYQESYNEMKSDARDRAEAIITASGRRT